MSARMYLRRGHDQEGGFLVSEGGGMKTPSHTNTGPKTRVAWWQVECEGPRVRCDGEVCAATGGYVLRSAFGRALGPVSTVTTARVPPGGLDPVL